MNNRNLFLAVLEAGESEVRVLAEFVASEGLLLGSQMAASQCSYGGRSEEFLVASF